MSFYSPIVSNYFIMIKVNPEAILRTLGMILEYILDRTPALHRAQHTLIARNNLGVNCPPSGMFLVSFVS